MGLQVFWKTFSQRIRKKKRFKIICQSRKNVKDLFFSNYPEISFLEINYLNKELNFQVFSNCSYIVNFINASVLNKNELKNFRSFLKNILLTSNASLIHISTASVFGTVEMKLFQNYLNVILKIVIKK